MDEEILGMPPVFVAELLAEGTKAEEGVTDAMRQLNGEMAGGGMPSDESLNRLMKLRDRLQDVNSALPATQEFLVSRGLTNVRELDTQGKAELREHLRLMALAMQADNELT